MGGTFCFLHVAKGSSRLVGTCSSVNTCVQSKLQHWCFSFKRNLNKLAPFINNVLQLLQLANTAFNIYLYLFLSNKRNKYPLKYLKLNSAASCCPQLSEERLISKWPLLILILSLRSKLLCIAIVIIKDEPGIPWDSVRLAEGCNSSIWA